MSRLVLLELRTLSRALRLSSQFGATCEMLTSARNVLDCAHAKPTPPFVN
jgi:hypothetical protein